MEDDDNGDDDDDDDDDVGEGDVWEDELEGGRGRRKKSRLTLTGATAVPPLQLPNPANTTIAEEVQQAHEHEQGGDEEEEEEEDDPYPEITQALNAVLSSYAEFPLHRRPNSALRQQVVSWAVELIRVIATLGAASEGRERVGVLLANDVDLALDLLHEPVSSMDYLEAVGEARPVDRPYTLKGEDAYLQSV